MSSSRKIVSGVIWSTTANIVNAIYGFIAVPILINHFGKTEYGLIGLAMSINVYMNLMDLGFNSTNVRFFSTWLSQKKIDRLRVGFQTSLSFYSIIGLLNGLVLLIVAAFSSSIFNVSTSQDLILKNLLYILAITAVCQWFSSCFDQVIKAKEDIAWIQKRTLLTKLFMVISLFVTVIFSLSIELYMILTSLSQLSIIPMSINKIKKEIPELSFFPKLDKVALLEMLPYCLNIFSFSIFQFSFYQLRPVFLGIQGTIESVADYRVLNGVIGVVTTLGGAFTGILLPSSSRVLAKNDRKAYYRMAYDGTKYISILSCFCCFGMMSVGTEVLTLYVGESFLYLIPWFNLWLLCTLGTHNQAISSLILAGTDIRAISYSSAVASICGLISAWFLIPYYAIGGVCIAFVIYLAIQLLFYYCYYWPKKMQIDSRRVFYYSFSPFLLTGIVVYFLSSNIPSIGSTVVNFLTKGVSFTILYVLATWTIMNKEDKMFIFSIIRKK